MQRLSARSSDIASRAATSMSSSMAPARASRHDDHRRGPGTGRLSGGRPRRHRIRRRPRPPVRCRRAAAISRCRRERPRRVHADRTRRAPPRRRAARDFQELRRRQGACRLVSTGAPGELLALTGPSGAGKTTCAGSSRVSSTPDEGALPHRRAAIVAAVPAASRRVAYMFESYALYPHLTVRRERAVAAAWRRTASGRAMPAQRVDVLLDLLEIPTRRAAAGGSSPAARSSGSRWRARWCRQPAVFLLDEPISHLDAKLRHKLRGEIRRRLVTAQPAPVIWCTPDAHRGLSVGDRIVVIDGGRIEQIGTPEEIWLRPATRAGRASVGDPPMNLLPGASSIEGERRCAFSVRGHRISHCPPGSRRPRRCSAASAKSMLGVRPDLVAARASGHARRHTGGDLFARAVRQVRHRHGRLRRRARQGEGQWPCRDGAGSASAAGLHPVSQSTS